MLLVALPAYSQNAEQAEALEALQSAISRRTADLEDLRVRLEAASDSPTRQRIELAIGDALQDIADYERQFEELAAGERVDRWRRAPDEPFDLQQELEKLVEPFVLELTDVAGGPRAATEIRQLREELEEERRAAAAGALRLRRLIDQRRAEAPPEDELLQRLMSLQQRGQRRAPSSTGASAS